ncbi:MAG: hypothetical protein QM702_25225 [Rubrivivax sp.]
MDTTPRECVPPLDDWKTIEEVTAAGHGKYSEHTIRYCLRNRETNGLAPAVRRLGKRLLISKSRFEAWLANGAGVRR